MKITTRVRYGVRLMLELAIYYGKGLQVLKDLAEKEGISEKYLSQIISILKAKGLVNSDRGAHGGYMLAKLPNEITVRNIFDALEGPINIVECIDNPSACDRIPTCITRYIWIKLRDGINSILDSITLEDLVKMCKGKEYSALIYNI